MVNQLKKQHSGTPEKAPHELQKQPMTIQKIIEELHKLRNTVLSMPSEKAVDFILNARQPPALVHSISEIDLYFLIKDIGVEDSLEVLSLASNSQWEFILDIATWKRDRIEMSSLTSWLNLRFLADPDRFIKWVMTEQTEFFEYYLFKNIQIRILEADEEPADIPDSFMTMDNTVFYRFLPDSEHMESSGEEDSDESGSDEERYNFITSFLKKLYSDDPIQYQSVLFETQTVIAPEAEEEAYRHRNIRLAEKGFLPFDDAIGVYQPLKPDAIPERIVSTKKTSDFIHPSLAYASAIMSQDSLFTGSLKTLENDDIFAEIETELASLANQLVVADQIKVESRTDLEKIVKKAIGYLTIGLERLSKGQDDVFHYASIIRTRMLSGIFRVGFGAALELKTSAMKWVKTSWFSSKKLPLSFWTEEWVGVLGGLLIKKPLFFDNYKTGGSLYRDFSSLDDIEKTRNVLDQIIGIDCILGLMSNDLALFLKSSPSRQMLSYKKLILTRWAQTHLGLSPENLPISMTDFILFFRELFKNTEEPEHAIARRVETKMKSSFLLWLSEKTGLTSKELTDKSGQEFDRLFSEIEDELGRVEEKNLDPRFIHLFIVSVS